MPAGRDVVIDAGRNTGGLPTRIPQTMVLVTAPCYLALRRALRGPTPDMIVVRREPGRSLDSLDVATVLGLEPWHVIEIDQDPAIARAVDAGLLVEKVKSSRQFAKLDQLAEVPA